MRAACRYLLLFFSYSSRIHFFSLAQYTNLVLVLAQNVYYHFFVFCVSLIETETIKKKFLRERKAFFIESEINIM